MKKTLERHYDHKARTITMGDGLIFKAMWIKEDFIELEEIKKSN